MDELLSSVQSRIRRIQEIMEKTNETMEGVYDQIRKYKEEEKIRMEKENWIINIMRNINIVTPDQQIHIYYKTNEIMTHLRENFSTIVTLNPDKPFLEEYFLLFDIFFHKQIILASIKPQLRSAVRQGHIINVVTELLKILLMSARQQFKRVVLSLSEQSISPMKPKERIKSISLIPPKLLERYAIKQRSSKNIILSKKHSKNDLMQSNENLTSYDPQLTINESSNTTSTNLLQSYISDRGYYMNIISVLDDLDEVFRVVMEYQSVKRPNQRNDEINNTKDNLYEKIRIRNSNISNSCNNYRQQLLNNQQTIQNFKKAFDKINRLDYHFCHINVRPMQGRSCECIVNVTTSKVTHKYNTKRKSVLSLKKSYLNVQTNELVQLKQDTSRLLFMKSDSVALLHRKTQSQQAYMVVQEVENKSPLPIKGSQTSINLSSPKQKTSGRSNSAYVKNYKNVRIFSRDFIIKINKIQRQHN